MGQLLLARTAYILCLITKSKRPTSVLILITVAFDSLSLFQYLMYCFQVLLFL